MGEPEILTVCYRVHVGETTVDVLLDATYCDERASVRFEGPTREVEHVRELLTKRARGMWEYAFDPTNTTAEHLRAAMASRAMHDLSPELIGGEAIFARKEPLNPRLFNAEYFAERLSRVIMMDRRFESFVDTTPQDIAEYSLRAWHAWRGSRTVEELAAEIAPFLSREAPHVDPVAFVRTLDTASDAEALVAMLRLL